MVNNNRFWNCPAVLFALALGVGAVLLLINVASVIFPIILWIALGFAILILVVVIAILAMPTSGNSSIVMRSLIREGSVIIISILGTFLTASVALAIQELLVAGTTSAAIIALIFLFGFFFGELIASVYFFLIRVFNRLDGGNTNNSCTTTNTIRLQ